MPKNPKVSKPDKATDAMEKLLNHWGWDSRRSQQNMIGLVEGAISDRKDLALNAPVGTGKTFGYLVPAILAGKKITVCTSTKSLQSQLLEDLEKLQEAMKELFDIHFTFASLKGVSNYPCNEAIKNMLGDLTSGTLMTGSDTGSEALVELQSKCDDFVDRAEGAPSSDQLTKEELLSNQELRKDLGKSFSSLFVASNCKKRRSKESFGCVIRTATEELVNADVRVINTALMATDIKRGFNSILQESDIVVIDEGHHLQDILMESWTHEASMNELTSLLDRVPNELDKAQDKVEEAKDSIEKLNALWHKASKKKLDPPNLLGRKHSQKFVELSMEALKRTESALMAFQNSEGGTKRKSKDLLADFHVVAAEFGNVQIHTTEEQNPLFLGSSPGVWLSIPTDIRFFRGLLNQVIGNSVSLIICSGTLHPSIMDQIGATSKYINLPSPFNPLRVRLFTPEDGDFPKPSEGRYRKHIASLIVDAVKAANGKAMILTTSHSAVRELYELTKKDLKKYTLLVQEQGGPGKNKLVQSFKDEKNSVLFATMGFWEGVDVPGESLSLVILDKIPFPIFGDPKVIAKRIGVEKEGGNAFYTVDIPHASSMLAQGVGRLIRKVEDHGGAIIFDPRITGSRYGQALLGQIDSGIPLETNFERFLDYLNDTVNGNDSPEKSHLPERRVGKKNLKGVGAFL